MLAIALFVLFVLGLVWVSHRRPCLRYCPQQQRKRLAAPALVYVPIARPRDTGNSDQPNSVFTAKSCARPASQRP
ncbi:MAG: hypothetical protein ACO35C_03985 [Pontimonas sp.]